MNQCKAEKLHREAIVIDGLNASYFFNSGVRKRLGQGGVTAVNATIAAWHSLPEIMDLIADYYQLFNDHKDRIMQIRSTKDIEKAKKKSVTGMIFGFQDTAPIHGNPRMLSVYHALGVRVIQLTYNQKNRIGCGCMAKKDSGLTRLGREVVSEMNRLGILIDLSHCGHRTTLDAIAASSQPAAFTHANPLALARSPRNKPDEAFIALAAKGGVAGVVLLPSWLTHHGKATVEDYLNAIDYLVSLIGIDHVGLGTDFMEAVPSETLATALQGISEETLKTYYADRVVKGFESADRFPNITKGLLARRYSMGDVKKIIGGNWMRLYKEVWTA
jgi:membrane dipeptidase